VYVPLIVLLEAPTASVAIGFPVIVKPTIGSVTITFKVVFLYWLLQSIGNYITYFSCSTYCSFSQEQYEGFVSMGYP
jgi:hypothetical protein